MDNFHFADINLYAVFLACIIHIDLGLLWFQPGCLEIINKIRL
jgi:hypothetical protein